MPMTLRILSGPGNLLETETTKVFEEDGGTIGRAPSCDWNLPDPENFVSGNHASVIWQDGEFFLIDEHVEDGTHFHTAAWTPRGVVVAMGDASARNENILYTCANWDDYANPFN